MSASAFLLAAMQFVSDNSNYGMRELPQLVIVKSQEAMNRECGSHDAYACYGQGVIYFPRSCDLEMTIECRGALIHEVYHYLDDMRFGMASCTEKYAYAMEDLYYKQNGTSLKELGYSDVLLKYLTSC